MMIFMLIGAVDRIQGNRWGYGQQFEEGFHAIGPMMLAMAEKYLIILYEYTVLS